MPFSEILLRDSCGPTLLDVEIPCSYADTHLLVFSQNHRMVVVGRWEGISGCHLVQHPEQGAQDHIQVAFEDPQQDRDPTASGQPVPVLCHCAAQKCSWCSEGTSCVPVLALGTMEKSLGRASWHVNRTMLQVFMDTEIPLSLFSRLSTSSSLSVS